MNLLKILLAATAIAALAQDQPPDDTAFNVTGTFNVVVGRRGDPQAPQLGMLGRIRANIAPDGSFTGTLERALFPDGSYLPALVFRGTPLLPDMDAPTSIPIEGQYTGRNVSLIVKFGDDPTKWIFGTGFSTQDPFKPSAQKTLVVAAGSTVGPEIGDQGDWQKMNTSVGDPQCIDIYINGIYHCTICAPKGGTVQVGGGGIRSRKE